MIIIFQVYGDNTTATNSTAPTPTGGGAEAEDLNPIVLKGWDNPRTKGNNSELLLPSDIDLGDGDPQIEVEILKLEKSHCDLVYVHCMGMRPIILLCYMQN